jgi:prepilin-type N-terminal cleavage/methylation domain-containing protein
MSERRGFTLVELLMGLIVMGLVAAVLARVFISQQRLTVAQVEQASMQANVRTGTLILANELRELGTGLSSGTDIKTFTATTLRYRAMRSLALACRVTSTTVRIRTTPIFGARPIVAVQDSMLVFVEGDPSTESDDRWASLRISGVSTPSTCLDGSPAISLTTSINTTTYPLASFGVTASNDAPVRTFEIMELAPVLAGGHNWLGAHSLTDPSALPLTPVAGPITVAGLTFSYLDASGNPTATRSAIRGIRITLRGQTDWDVRPGGAIGVPMQPLLDSLVTTVTIRNAPVP